MLAFLLAGLPLLPPPDEPAVFPEDLLEDLRKTRYALEVAYSGFDNVTDPDLIDCYIYEVNSIMKRYRYLLNQAANLNPLPEEETTISNPESPVGALVG